MVEHGQMSERRLMRISIPSHLAHKRHAGPDRTETSSVVRVRARSEIGLQTDVWRKFWTTQSKHRKSLIETSVDKEMKKF